MAAHLMVEKDFGMFKTQIFTSWSDLNHAIQFQAGTSFTVYPSGNPDFYSVTTLMAHTNEGQSNLVVDETVGVRVIGNIWTDLYFTFGNLKNYYDRNASNIYNVSDLITFIGGNRWTCYVKGHLGFSVDYKVLGREAEYLQYHLNGNGSGNQEIKSRYVTYNYYSHLLLGGITWKF
jgi:hypothetical protein